jgi:hypothetical protein
MKLGGYRMKKRSKRTRKWSDLGCWFFRRSPSLLLRRGLSALLASRALSWCGFGVLGRPSARPLRSWFFVFLLFLQKRIRNQQSKDKMKTLIRRTLGGRPRFRGTDGADELSAPAASVFLFLLPFGRPRPRLTGCALELPR